jgi:hypothetical protein
MEGSGCGPNWGTFTSHRRDWGKPRKRLVSTRRLENGSAEYEANHWTVTFGGHNNCKMYKSALFHYIHIFLIYKDDNMYYARSWILTNTENIVDWEEILITAWQCVMQPSCEASKAGWPRQHGGIQHTAIHRWNTARQQHDNKLRMKAVLTNPLQQSPP